MCYIRVFAIWSQKFVADCVARADLAFGARTTFRQVLIPNGLVNSYIWNSFVYDLGGCEGVNPRIRICGVADGIFELRPYGGCSYFVTVCNCF